MSPPTRGVVGKSRYFRKDVRERLVLGFPVEKKVGGGAVA